MYVKYFTLTFNIILFLYLLPRVFTQQNNNSLENQIRYDTPDDCHFQSNINNDISLICNLRTINSEFDTTNFSVIPSEHTVELNVICNDEIMTKSYLESKSFSHLINLKYLTVKFCKISKFFPEILYGLDNLKNLTIQTNNIIWADFNLDLEINSFRATKNLERLDLGQNNIWTLPQHIFCTLSRLTFLNISQNRLQDINELGFRDKIIEESTSETSSTNIINTSSSSNNNSNNKNNSSNQDVVCSLDLEILDLSYNNFVLLPAHGFGILKRLKYLKLNNNEISMVADKALNGLKNLKILNLNSNKIVALPSELFVDAANSIQEVYLQNNSITVLSPKLFFNLTQLQALDLSFNQITSTWIDKNTFMGLIRLVLLNLSHNRITKLEPYFFADLYTLQILNLRHNQLDNIEANTFSSMNNLHTLLLSYNKIKYLDAHALNGLYVLSLISIDNNQITDVHQDSFRNCSSLQDINLNGNQLNIVPLALRNMRLLRTLDLGENSITSLEQNSFEGLQNLYGLRLIQNSLKNITSNMFKDLPSLQILNLAHNNIANIETGSFDKTPSIQAIRLDGNNITDIHNLFVQIPSLLWLNISDNKLENFDLSQISNNLQWLDIHKNKIQKISNKEHKGNQIRLQTFDVSFNQIEQVTPDSIPNSIELLFLNDNLITSVEPDTFLEKSNLTRVDLYANQIKTLDIKSFRIYSVTPGKTLPEFYIGGNPFTCDCNIEWLQKINSLSTRQYPKIMDLETIYCKLLNTREKAYISLVKAKSKHFLCPYITHCFALCHCCDFDACDCEMTCPSNCTCFHDQSWSTNIVECSNANYTEIPSNIPMDTTEVYIDGNNLIELSGHSFIGRKNLAVLYANNSNIQVIYNTTFSGLKRLIILHLEQNKIHRLYGHEFNNLENLRELFLQNNKINLIANGTFVHMAKLEILRLEGNKLVQFEVWQLTLNPLLIQIGLAGNVWSCECSYLSRFRTFLQINSEKIIDANRVACIYNNMSSILKEKNGTKCTLREGISTYVRGSEIENLLPLLLVGTCAFVLFFGLILGLFCYRQELCSWAQSNCIFKMCFKSTEYIENYHKDRLYDAYIAYSLQDEHFVNQILGDTLENDIGYRLGLHYRDLNLNLYITDIILEAVDNSKQAILVLSKNFLYNEWTRFEYKSALHEIVNKRCKLVFILYGDLPQRDLDTDMRHYLRTSTCIEWDDKKFWQKLRLALPNPVKRQLPQSQPQQSQCLKNRNTSNIYGSTHHDYSTVGRNHLSSSKGVYDCSNFQRINNCGRKYSSNFDTLSCNYNPVNQKNNLSINTIDKKHEYAIPSNCLITPNSIAGNTASNYGISFDHQQQNLDTTSNGLDFLLTSQCTSTTLPNNNTRRINNDIESNPTISNSAVSICNLSLSRSVSSSGSINAHLNNFNNTPAVINSKNFNTCNNCNDLSDNNLCNCNNQNDTKYSNNDINCKTNKIIQTLWS